MTTATPLTTLMNLATLANEFRTLEGLLLHKEEGLADYIRPQLLKATAAIDEALAQLHDPSSLSWEDRHFWLLIESYRTLQKLVAESDKRSVLIESLGKEIDVMLASVNLAPIYLNPGESWASYDPIFAGDYEAN